VKAAEQQTFIAVDPNTGLALRKATPVERSAYEGQPCRGPIFRRPVKVGAVLVDEWNGPGLCFEVAS
jgi:hypothetical protein